MCSHILYQALELLLNPNLFFGHATDNTHTFHSLFLLTMALVYADIYYLQREPFHLQLRRCRFLFVYDNLLPIRGVNASIVVTLPFPLLSFITPSQLQRFLCIVIFYNSLPWLHFNCFLASIIRLNNSCCLSLSNKTSLTFSKPKRLSQGAVLSA